MADAACWCCGEPASIRGEGDPWEGRLDGYCTSCATTRCDTTDSTCAVKGRPKGFAALRYRPRLLDLFCGPGFASRGYHDAGWDVTGVDIEDQTLYPYEFVQEGALAHLEWLLYQRSQGEPIPFEGIHASPPCFKFSSITAVSGDPGAHLDLIVATRSLLEQTGLPWVIENVPRSPLREPYVICGTAMGCSTIDGLYRLKRHRHFETTFPLLVPPCACAGDKREVLGVYGSGTSQATRVRSNPSGGNTNKANTQQARELYGLAGEALPRSAMNLGFPPSYTELVGEQMLRHVREAVAE